MAKLAEKERAKRKAELKSLLVAGHNPTDQLEALAEKYQSKESYLHELLNEIFAELASEDGTRPKNAWRAILLERLELLYTKCLEAGDLKTALSTIREKANILDLYTQDKQEEGPAINVAFTRPDPKLAVIKK